MPTTPNKTGAGNGAMMLSFQIGVLSAPCLTSVVGPMQHPRNHLFYAGMKSRILAFLFTIAAACVYAADDKTDVWQPTRFFIGHWKGTTEGEPGIGTVERTYGFILRDRNHLKREKA